MLDKEVSRDKEVRRTSISPNLSRDGLHSRLALLTRSRRYVHGRTMTGELQGRDVPNASVCSLAEKAQAKRVTVYSVCVGIT